MRTSKCAVVLLRLLLVASAPLMLTSSGRPLHSVNFRLVDYAEQHHAPVILIARGGQLMKGVLP